MKIKPTLLSGLLLALCFAALSAQPAFADRTNPYGFAEVQIPDFAEVPKPEPGLLCPIAGDIPKFCDNFWEESGNFASAFCCAALTTINGKPVVDHPDAACCADECLVFNANFQLIGNVCAGCQAPMYPECE